MDKLLHSMTMAGRVLDRLKTNADRTEVVAMAQHDDHEHLSALVRAANLVRGWAERSGTPSLLYAYLEQREQQQEELPGCGPECEHSDVCDPAECPDGPGIVPEHRRGTQRERRVEVQRRTSETNNDAD